MGGRRRHECSTADAIPQTAWAPPFRGPCTSAKSLALGAGSGGGWGLAAGQQVEGFCLMAVG